MLKDLFNLNPNITFLNFGSYGACPKPIMEDLRKWQMEMESEPVQFIKFRNGENLRKSRTALADYIHCNADDLVYVPNPTYAINIIAKSLALNPGDEILSTDIEYGAMDRTWNYYCKKSGAKFVRQEIYLPIISKEMFLLNFWKGFTENTKAIFISQITSTTGLKLPVKEICEEAKRRGLLTIVDGAHVPGHVPLDLRELQADIYTGACHKWMMTPKGSSFLYVKKELQNQFDPLVISWGYESDAPSKSQFLDYHEQQGTRDFTAFLTIPKSIEFMKENNWTAVAKQCAELAQSNYSRFCELLHTLPLCPINNDFLGQMCSIPIRTSKPEQLKSLLYDKYKIEIPVMVQGDNVFLRYSIQAFNSQQDLDTLYKALEDILRTSDLLVTNN
ncbi:MAG: aminotransferase class V-fold PLP-dependent enzyme [Bacteroidetes bacterium]|nr:aminotransferase class V-fold PLP-dependent enzyme [Bacteroidota bacterium]